ncbi:MAG TPA: VIT1/CCC1 transporter family protein, partial [Acidimicrobiales bacterium]|nr:VIT1/CCC1 transporter family protein [Acidimicrobiales bacterium]
EAVGQPAGDAGSAKGPWPSPWGRGRRPGRHRVAAEIHQRDHHHRSLSGGGARAAVFGFTDGLVTNVAIILGFAGAHPGGGFVRLAGLSGLIAGAFSMASGEFVSMRAQKELLERELALERHEIRHRPEGERRELVRIYEGRGVDPSLARQLADEMMRTPELALETHAREELGIDPTSLGSPVQAALSSFVMFALGALLPLVPWLFARGTGATVASIVIGAFAALGAGVLITVLTEQRRWWSTFLPLLFCAAAAGVTYGIGSAVGVSAG